MTLVRLMISFKKFHLKKIKRQLNEISKFPTSKKPPFNNIFNNKRE